MDIELAHGQAQRVLWQRNVLALTTIAMGCALVAALIVAANKDREVVLVPTLHSPVTLTSASVAPEYLEMVTRDVALIALNRSPQSLNWWMDSILDLTDNEARGSVKAGLMKIIAEQQNTQITQYFTPDTLEVDTKKLTSTVGGTLHTVVASKEVSAEHRSFRFTWINNGIALKLTGFGMIDQQDAKP